jgi:hypothetical protein
MPRRIDISSEARAAVNRWLLAHNFSRYVALSRLLLKRYGVRVSKSTLHEWGQSFRAEYEAAQRLALRANAVAAGGGGTPVSTRALEQLAGELIAAAAVRRGTTKKYSRERRRVRRRA